MKPLIYTIIEHQSFGVDEITTTLQCTQTKAKKLFEALENFTKGKNNEGFLRYYGKTKLKAQNYVGIIQTKHGTLEILPKCFREEQIQTNTNQENPTNREKLKQDKKINKDELKEFFALKNFENQFCEEPPKIKDFKLFDTSKKSAQNFLLFCLKSLKNSPFKSSNLSSLGTTYTPLLEIFMKMFCDELLEVCKKGIRHDYVAIEDNRTFLKGKLLFSGQIRHNLVHKERFYTSSDEYIADIAPNRLIKSTLELISTLSTSHSTQMLINQCLEVFEEIPSSGNIEGDFLSCTSSRHFGYYDNLLKWCELFLQNKSFTAFSGENQAYALLFPMEKLFESYVAYMFKQGNKDISIKAQSSSRYLLHTQGSPLFQLKPDLLFELKGKNKKTIIADTKWKVLKNTEDKKHGISQADLYQLFAYAHYHNASEVWLIYPKLYEQSDKKEREIEKIIKKLSEWNAQPHYYCHPCAFEEGKKHHKIEVKIFFAPLAFH